MTADPGSDVGELVSHLASARAMRREEAEQLVAEICSFFAERVEEFVRRRHRELQSSGLRNEAIWTRIGRELADRRFAAPPLSARQLRRIVYG